MAAWRRLFARPKRLDPSRDAWLILFLIKVLIVTDGATIARLDWATGKTLSEWQFRKEVPEGFGGGLRGGISAALALGLPPSAVRPALLAICYSVVVFSIIVQGLTVERVARRFYRMEQRQSIEP